jgi:hypothetical protein
MGIRSNNYGKTGALLAGGALFAAAMLVSSPAYSQGRGAANAAADAAKPTPRTADGHPDLNGQWNDSPTGNLNAAGRTFERSSDGSILFDFSTSFNDGKLCVDDSCQQPNQPPYKPEYMTKVKAIAATEYGGSTSLDPEMLCKPYGIPRGSVGGAMQIVQTPQLIAILYEGHPQPSSIYRIIYMDGRPHPKDLDTTFMGHSIGHWEGDTLVVDVTGLSDETWLGGDINGRQKYTSIHSDKEHVVERWTRKGDTMTFEATVDDPVMFTKPWVVTPKRLHVATDGVELEELFCTPQGTGEGHFVAPDDKDIKTQCSYRCEDRKAN